MVNIAEKDIVAKWKDKDLNNPKVSVCCISFNQERYIQETIDGFLMQKTSFPFEVLIHDDASTDRTADIIREYEGKFPKIIKPIYQKENQYSKGNRAILASFVYPRAKGKYIALCEGDDYWIDEHKLQMQVDFLENNSDYGMCFSNAEIINGNMETQILTPNIKKNKRISTKEIIKQGGMFVPTPSMVFRYEVLNGYPDFCKSCWVGDYPLQIYNALKGKIYFFSKSFVAYRKNAPGSWTKKNSKKTFLEKKEGIESELRMLNGLNKLSNYKLNSTFMIRKIEFLGINVLSEKKLVIDNNFLNYRFYFYLPIHFIKRFLIFIKNRLIKKEI